MIPYRSPIDPRLDHFRWSMQVRALYRDRGRTTSSCFMLDRLGESFVVCSVWSLCQKSCAWHLHSSLHYSCRQLPCGWCAFFFSLFLPLGVRVCPPPLPPPRDTIVCCVCCLVFLIPLSQTTAVLVRSDSRGHISQDRAKACSGRMC